MKKTLLKIKSQLKAVVILLIILNTVLIFGLFKRSSAEVQARELAVYTPKSCKDVNIVRIGGVPIYSGAIPVRVVK